MLSWRRASFGQVVIAELGDGSAPRSHRLPLSRLGSIVSHMSTQNERVAGILGLSVGKSAAEPMYLARAVERGLPVRALTRVFDAIASDEPRLRYAVVPRATFARKQNDGSTLSPEQSDRVVRIARLWAMAIEVWHDEEAARAFLLRPHPLLEGERPIDVARTTEGARLVEGVLGRLQHGTSV